MKFLLTLRMEDGSKKQVEATGKTLTDIFYEGLSVDGVKEIIKSERVAELDECLFVTEDGKGLYNYGSERRWVKPKVPTAPIDVEPNHRPPDEWYIEIDDDGKPLPGYWLYYKQGKDYGSVTCCMG